MRPLLVLAVALSCAATGTAQNRSTNTGNYGRIMFPGGEVPGGPNRSGTAFPGTPASTGRILFPGTAAPAFVNGSYPLFLGNNLPTIDHQPHDRTRPGPGRTQRSIPVAFPVYYGGGYYPYEPPLAEQSSPINYNSQNVFTGSGLNGAADPGPASPVVIINQYFQVDPSGASNSSTSVTRQQVQPQQIEPPAPTIEAPVQQARAQEDDLSRLFLIALNDSNVLTASAYWVEDDTLNYITTSGSHNRVSMELVNRRLSERLNAERHVTFGLPSTRPAALDVEVDAAPVVEN